MFEFPNLPTELNCMIDEYVIANYKRAHEKKMRLIFNDLLRYTSWIYGAMDKSFDSLRYNKKIYLDSPEKAVHVVDYQFCVREIRSGNFKFVRRPPEFILQDSNFPFELSQ